MLQVNLLRQHTDWVKQRLAVKNFKQPELVDTIVALDDERKKLQGEFDLIQSKINSSSKDIGELMKKGQREQADAAKAEVSVLKNALEPLKTRMEKVETDLQNNLVQLPNLPAKEVPVGKTPEDNVVVRQG